MHTCIKMYRLLVNHAKLLEAIRSDISPYKEITHTCLVSPFSRSREIPG